MSATKRKANGQRVSVSSAESTALSVRNERNDEADSMDTAEKAEDISVPADLAVRSVRAGKADKVNWDDRAVYSLRKTTSDNIVDLVLRIMDAEGPRPMRNLRPAEKNRNGADQFYVTHHAQYEARGQQSRNKIGRVHTHNNAYPKMYDELHKRQSTAQVYPGPADYAANPNINLEMHYDPNCRNCVKLKKQAEIGGRKRQTRTRTKPSRYHRDYRTKSTVRDTIKTKITKPKRPRRRYRSPSRLYKLSKIKLNKGCQCTCYYIPAETKSVSTFNDNPLSMPIPTAGPVPMQPLEVKMAAFNAKNNDINFSKMFSTAPSQAPKKLSEKVSKKSDVDSGNPDSVSVPSMSSYNSYMSMDHEPMGE